MKFNKLIGLLKEDSFDDDNYDDSEAYNEPEPEDYEEKDPTIVQNFGEYTLELADIDSDDEVIEFIVSKDEMPIYYVTYAKGIEGPDAISVNTHDKKRVSYYEFYKDFGPIADYIKSEFV